MVNHFTWHGDVVSARSIRASECSVVDSKGLSKQYSSKVFTHRKAFTLGIVIRKV